MKTCNHNFTLTCKNQKSIKYQDTSTKTDSLPRYFFTCCKILSYISYFLSPSNHKYSAQKSKHISGLALILFLIGGSAFAQLSITPYSGYTFADKTPISGGHARIGDGHTYGVYLSYGLSDSYELELQYSRQDNKVSANYRYTNILGGISYVDITEPASVNYIMIGTNKLYPANEKITLFSGLKLGASIISSKDDNFDTLTRFAVNINGGMRYFFNDKIGLRLQADLGMPMVNLGGSFWWSPKNGVDVGVSGYSPFLQFGFKGGLIFRM